MPVQILPLNLRNFIRIWHKTIIARHCSLTKHKILLMPNANEREDCAYCESKTIQAFTNFIPIRSAPKLKYLRQFSPPPPPGKDTLLTLAPKYLLYSQRRYVK